MIMDAETGLIDVNTALILACEKSGNIENVRFLLENNANPNSRGSEGRTVLQTAALSGNAQVLELLIAHGADIEATDDKKNTALIVACTKPGNIDCVRILLVYKANPNAYNSEKKTAVHIAILNGDLETVKLLISYGADLESRTGHGETTYLLSAQTLNGEVIEVLHQAPVNTEAVTSAGRNALMVVLKEIRKRKMPFDDAIKTILHSMIYNGVAVNHMRKNGATTLMDAAVKENVEVLHFLLDVNADVHVRGTRGSSVDGETALSLLLEYGDWNSKKCQICVRELIKRGAINSLSNSLFLLKKLIHEKKQEIIYLLLTNGVAPARYQSCHKTTSGMAIDSPLKQALATKNTDLLRCFLNNLVLCPHDVSNQFYHLHRDELVSEQDSSAQEIVRLMDEFYSQPLSLFTQSFVIVSNAVGGVPGRVERVNSLPVLEKIKDMLLFKNINFSVDVTDSNSRDDMDWDPCGSSSDSDSDCDADIEDSGVIEHMACLQMET